jgi:hypothetical protein
MKSKLIVMMLFAVSLQFLIHTPAYGIPPPAQYTINIDDASEIMNALISPAGTGNLLITPEQLDTPGTISWDFTHTINTDAVYTYNIFEPEDPQKLSDTLYVSMDHTANMVHVLFTSDSISEDDITPYVNPTGVLSEVDKVNYQLPYGASLTVTFVSPEPSTFVLLGACAVSLLAYRWRRRKLAA